jgi:hypothetical protein
MTQRRILLVGLLTVALSGMVLVTVLFLGLLAPPKIYREVPPGDQEVVVLMPATSADTWERLVAAIDALKAEADAGSGKLRLRVDKGRAFVEQTADVPEVALWVDGAGAKVWVRWYKLGGPNTVEHWLEALCRRPPPPLAIIGGDNSYQARKLAEALRDCQGRWQGPAPVLLISTATADQYDPKGTAGGDPSDPNLPQLIGIYKDRSLRFSFTNSRMAEVILAFVRTHDELWPRLPHPAAIAAAAVQPDILASSVAALAAEYYATYTLHVVAWEDDRYSEDLASRFTNLFAETFHGPAGFPNPHIPCSAGDFYYANFGELHYIDELLDYIKKNRGARQLLVLPTGADRARRFLRTLLRTAGRPDVRHLVVITGDAINFNTIYRDHKVTWNIHDLEAPLVLFSHRNPIDASVGFAPWKAGKPLSDSTGTEDLLLYRDILEAVLLCAYRGGTLVHSADDLLANLRRLDWVDGRVRAPWDQGNGHRAKYQPRPLFDPGGNRHMDTGEHVIVLMPPNEHNLGAQAQITVWRLQGDPARHDNWKEVPPSPLMVKTDND